MIKKLTCIVCPRGCEMTVDTDGLKVSGHTCPRGEAYAVAEITNPKRTLTSTVRVQNRENTVLSVKTANEISKNDLFNALEAVKMAAVNAPVKIGDVIIEDVFGSPVVATKNID